MPHCGMTTANAYYSRIGYLTCRSKSLARCLCMVSMYSSLTWDRIGQQAMPVRSISSIFLLTLPLVSSSTYTLQPTTKFLRHLGVALIYIILRALTHILDVRLGLKGFESGQYGTPPSIKYWLRQAAVYVLSLTSMKLLVVGLFALYPGIFSIGNWLLSWTRSGDNETFQVIL